MRPRTSTFRRLSLPAVLLTLLWLGGDAAAQFGCSSALIRDELNTIRTGMELAFIDTSRFHTIEDLNDQATANPTFFFDDINEQGFGTLTLLPNTGEFHPSSPENLVAPLRWNGPYVTYQQGRIDPDSTYDPGSPTTLGEGSQPYHLYSALGLVFPEGESITLDFYGDLFDRWALVSAGCDGIFLTGDDVIVEFGSAPAVPRISSVRPATAARGVLGSPPPPIESGDTIVVRGYNFGTSQGSSRLLLDGQDLGTAAEWTDREIVLDLPPGVLGSEIALELGGNVVDTFGIEIVTAVSNWILYE